LLRKTRQITYNIIIDTYNWRLSAIHNYYIKDHHSDGEGY